MVKFDDELYDEAEKLVQRFATPSGTGSTQGTTAGSSKYSKFNDWFSWDTVFDQSSCSGNGVWTLFPLRRAKSTTG